MIDPQEKPTKSSTCFDQTHVEQNQALAIAACVGFGLLLAWKHINISPTLFDTPTRHVIEQLRIGGLETAPLFIAVPLILGVLADRRKPLPERPVVACAAILLGLTIASLYCFPSILKGLMLIAGNACALLSAVLLLYWAKLLCETVPENPLCYCALAFLVCFGVALLSTRLPAFLAGMFHVLIPIVSGLMLTLLQFRTEVPPNKTLCGKRPTFTRPPLRLFFGLGIVAMCIDMTNLFSETKTTYPDEQCLLIVGLLSSLAVLALASMKNVKNFAESFKWVLLLIVLSMFFSLLFEFEQKIYETAALALAGCLFRIFSYATIYEVVIRTIREPLFVLGVGEAILTATQFLNPLIYAALATFGLPSVAVAAVITILAIVTIVFLLAESYLSSILSNKIAFTIQDDTACQRCIEKAAREYGLTNREEQIAFLILKRKDNVEIHQELFIAPSTLRVHLRSIYKKVGVHSRADLIEGLESFAKED